MKRTILTFAAVAIAITAAFSAYCEENPISAMTGGELSGPFIDYIYRFIGANEEKPLTPEDSPSAVKIGGKYRMNFGYQFASTDDFYWKNANSEMNGYNFRYLYGEKTYNTFNPNVFDSFELNMDVKPPSNWSTHMDMVVDPWAFVGETEKVKITGSWGSTVVLQLPYWSNTERTRNLTARTSIGDTLNIPEIAGKDGDTEPARGIMSGWGEVFDIPAIPVNREFKPIKNLWLDYDAETWDFKIFPFAEQAYAMSSDDPLGLSGHHIYWEPNPWISYWTPGVNYSAIGWESGYWTADSAEGRLGERLRLLRGASLEGEFGPVNIQTMIASSLSPWNHYENINNMSFAGRIKTALNDNLSIGTTYTGRTGMTDYHLESYEHAYAVDGALAICPGLTLSGEFAQSYNGLDVNKDLETEDIGNAVTARLNYESGFDIGGTVYNLAFTHMGDDFDPPLATYANTRDDQSWSDHIEFKERSIDDRKIRIGDGIDADRNTFLLRNETALFEKRFFFLNDYRRIYSTGSGKFLHETYRNESTVAFSESVTGKTLVLSRDRHPGEDTERSWIFGSGLQCALTDMITVEGIYERANEYPYWPQAAASWLSVNPKPPYPFFNMYKLKAIFEPFENLEFEYNHCRNGFKYATGVADNINYDGAEVRWLAAPKLSTRIVYRHSRTIDLNHQIATGEERFRGHDNLYAELNWEMWKDKNLTVQFGDLGEFVSTFRTDPASYTDRASIQPDVLDMQEIVRVTFTGVF